MSAKVDITSLMSLLSLAHKSSHECQEAQNIKSCNDCGVSEHCGIKKSIEKGEKALEEALSR